MEEDITRVEAVISGGLCKCHVGGGREVVHWRSRPSRILNPSCCPAASLDAAQKADDPDTETCFASRSYYVGNGQTKLYNYVLAMERNERGRRLKGHARRCGGPRGRVGDADEAPSPLSPSLDSRGG